MKRIFYYLLIFLFICSLSFAQSEKSSKQKSSKKERDKKEKVTTKNKSSKEIIKKNITEDDNESLTDSAKTGLILDYNRDLFLVDSSDEESLAGGLEWNIYPKDDNNNPNLPPKFRNWWYVKLEGLSTSSPNKINIIGDGWQGKYYVVPVYSYDKINWFRFKPEEIFNTESSGSYFNYYLLKKFEKQTVWVARYYPYTFNRLKNLLKSLEKNPYVKIETIGKTPQNRPIVMLTITDFSVDDKQKRRVWIHSRTHPSETGSSFVVEGLIKYLISECNTCCSKVNLKKIIFNIVPMVNIDGVVAGNSRTAPITSKDLERQWIRSSDNNSILVDTVATEVKILEKTIRELINLGPKFFIALNLHQTHSPPNHRPFLFSNFSRKGEVNGEEGEKMFTRHLVFSKLISSEYCGDTVYVRPSYNPGQSMEKKVFPESWWWANFKDEVLAITIENTVGIDGCFEEWVNFQDQIKLGEAIALAIGKYHQYYIEKKWFRYEAPDWDLNELMKFFLDSSGDQ